MSRKSRRSRRGSSAVQTAAAAGVLIVLLAVGVAGGYFIWREHRETASIDPETLCPRHGQSPHTSILIDASDAFTETQKQRLEAALDEIIDDLSLHEWLGIYVLESANPSLTRPKIGKCYPGGAAEANPLYQNPQQLQRSLESNFEQPLAEAMRQIAAASAEQDNSPILEMIAAVATDTGYAARGGGRRLIIVSDMLHNTPEYSHYRASPDFASFRNLEYARPFLERFLADARVEILHVRRPRDERFHNRRYISFWEEYFAAVGASLERVQAL